MSDQVMPPAPSEQVQLRARLERALAEWGVSYRHEDRGWSSPDGRQVVYGWGTVIDRGPSHAPLRVWFDGLDRDVAIYGDTRHRLHEYFEWLDLTSMDDVLDQLESALAGLLAAPQTRPRSRSAAVARALAWRRGNRRQAD